MLSDDMKLVREYAENGSESAFAKLVSQHINLVYSVALRQVRDTHLAEEIAQGVFIILARKAKSLKGETVLSSWLCRTARHVSADALKIQRRRKIREQEAHMQSILNENEPQAWEHIAPILDDALGSLEQKDHDAVVLRYFEGKDLREVGAALGMKEDAARMRVNRGLEKLRKFFGRKGVTLSAGMIAASVAANSIQAAPAGLAAVAIKSALSGTLTGAVAGAATKTIAMTTLQKILVSASITVLVGAGIYEARQATRFRDEAQTLRQKQASIAAQLPRLQRERDEAMSQLAASVAQKDSNDELLKLRSEVTRLRLDSQELAKLKSAPTAKTKSLKDDVETLFTRVRLLKQRFAQRPAESIPELKFLTEDDWLRTASKPKQLVTDEDFRPALSELRANAEGNFLREIETSLRKFINDNNNRFPTDLAQLKQYFDQQPGDEILQRYQIVPASSFPAAGAMRDTGDWLIVLKDNLKEPGDDMWALDRNGVIGFANTRQMNILAPAIRALSENTASDPITGRKSVNLHQLEPYLTTPEEKAAYQQLLAGHNTAQK